jgi:hypothetical protein
VVVITIIVRTKLRRKIMIMMMKMAITAMMFIKMRMDVLMLCAGAV